MLIWHVFQIQHRFESKVQLLPNHFFLLIQKLVINKFSQDKTMIAATHICKVKRSIHIGSGKVLLVQSKEFFNLNFICHTIGSFSCWRDNLLLYFRESLCHGADLTTWKVLTVFYAFIKVYLPLFIKKSFLMFSIFGFCDFLSYIRLRRVLSLPILSCSGPSTNSTTLIEVFNHVHLFFKHFLLMYVLSPLFSCLFLIAVLIAWNLLPTMSCHECFTIFKPLTNISKKLSLRCLTLLFWRHFSIAYE